MKKSKKILAIVAILLIALLAFVGGQAYAKYFAQVQGKGVASVATWDFKINGSNTEEQQIDLSSTCNDETLINNKIAPGTKGSFNIDVDGTGSEVGIDYKVTFKDEKDKPQNLKFVYNGVKYDSIEELNNKISGTIDANASDKQRVINVEWQWEYETGVGATQISANDLIDTQDAKAMKDYTFVVAVTGTQVEPNA